MWNISNVNGNTNLCPWILEKKQKKWNQCRVKRLKWRVWNYGVNLGNLKNLGLASSIEVIA
jgi:hypothetical protein